jgi:hypothetical protein
VVANRLDDLPHVQPGADECGSPPEGAVAKVDLGELVALHPLRQVAHEPMHLYQVGEAFELAVGREDGDAVAVGERGGEAVRVRDAAAALEVCGTRGQFEINVDQVDGQVLDELERSVAGSRASVALLDKHHHGSVDNDHV